ncbi:MAG: hypothetical protein IVW57_13480 [Ktedonobacterales bacterium]|nr:hypothetical protein [Ktedonobacterales bacterium]
MDLRSVARRYGWAFGGIAGIFALAQVFVSAAAALANWGTIGSAQRALANGTANPQFIFGPLVPTLVATYLAMILTGAIMLALCWRAGRFAAYVTGRIEAGMVAGGWVALVSGLIWIVLTIVVTLVAHADGTVTGLFTANPSGPLRPLELPGLLVQEFGAGLIGWGLGSLAGLRGAESAPLPPPALPPIAPRMDMPGMSGLPRAPGQAGAWPLSPPPPPYTPRPAPSGERPGYLPPRHDGGDAPSMN